MTSASVAPPAGGSSSMMVHSHGWPSDAGSSAEQLAKGLTLFHVGLSMKLLGLPHSMAVGSQKEMV